MLKTNKCTTPWKKRVFLHVYFQWNYNTLYTKYLLQVLNIKSCHKRPRKFAGIITISWCPSPSVWVGWSVLWQCSQPSLALNWPFLTLPGLCTALWQISFHFLKSCLTMFLNIPCVSTKLQIKYLADPGDVRGSSTNSFGISWVTHSLTAPFWKYLYWAATP